MKITYQMPNKLFMLDKSTLRCPECNSDDIWFNFLTPEFYCAACHLEFCEHSESD